MKSMSSITAWLSILLVFLVPVLVASAGSGAATRAANNGNGSAMSTFVKTIMDARRHLVAAAVARSTSIFAMYPVDTIKVSAVFLLYIDILCQLLILMLLLLADPNPTGATGSLSLGGNLQGRGRFSQRPNTLWVSLHTYEIYV